MLIRNEETTEDRIAKIAQGFGQGLQNFQQAQDRSRNQNLQAEALKRQEAIQALEVSSNIAAQTGKYIDPGTVAPMIKSGDLSGIGEILKTAPNTRKTDLELEDRQMKKDAAVLDGQYKQSQIDKNNKYQPKSGAASSNDKLVQKQMEKLGVGNAGLFNVKSAMDEALVILSDPKMPEDQKIKTGQSLFKLLNSAEGSDAVGAEEAKRLGSYLEYNVGNFTQPGAFVGRDLKGFTDQVSNYSKLLDGRIRKNEEGVNLLRGGGSLSQGTKGQSILPQQQVQPRITDPVIDAKVQRLQELRAKKAGS